ncbi:MAG TPA: M50 family metallopeptidase [Acidimicrobiales bacterium]
MTDAPQPPTPPPAPPPPDPGRARARRVMTFPEGDGRPSGQAHQGRTGLVLLVLGILALGLLGGLPMLIVVLAIIVMVFFHELGHYLTAKAAGMKVTEFFIGFGPRIWSFRRGETEYGLKAVPAGAYVRIIGMHNLDEVDPADEPRTYRQQPFWRRLSVAVAGSGMHFLMALLLLFGIFAFHGIDRDEARWTVGAVTEGSAADEAGLQPGDRVVAVDGRAVETFDDLRAEVTGRPGDEVSLTVEREGGTRTLEATLGDRNPATGERVGFLGVGADAPYVRDDPLTAAGRSFTTFGSMAKVSVQALGSFFTPGGLSEYTSRLFDGGGEETATEPGSGDEGRVISVVGAVRLGAEQTEAGWVGLAEFLVTINVFVGIFNLVPLLPLDGGHVAIATYERIRSRRGRPYRVDVAKLMPLTYGVVALLVFVAVTSLYLDLVDPVSLGG